MAISLTAGGIPCQGILTGSYSWTEDKSSSNWLGTFYDYTDYYTVSPPINVSFQGCRIYRHTSPNGGGKGSYVRGNITFSGTYASFYPVTVSDSVSAMNGNFGTLTGSGDFYKRDAAGQVSANTDYLDFHTNYYSIRLA